MDFSKNTALTNKLKYFDIEIASDTYAANVAKAKYFTLPSGVTADNLISARCILAGASSADALWFNVCLTVNAWLLINNISATSHTYSDVVLKIRIYYYT